MKHSRPGIRDSGFTLIEALVALLALSIGLLGIAALQLNGLRNNLSSAYRSQATYLAYDIIDRIRANRANRADYEIDLGAAPMPSNVTTRDLAAWKTNLATTLPRGDGTVTVDGADSSVIIVTVQWSDSRDENEGPLVFRSRTRI
ncbi:MAG: type IV pilus modification protein PilV [Proteobacteria bacterium]|nr:MAG: type IV pilus modification protein PilV [Pseudomonadota bacterium]